MPVPPERLARTRAYLMCMMTGFLGYFVIAAVLVAAYVLIQGRGFFIPMTWSNLGFIFMGAIFASAFAPFMGLHLIATALRLQISPLSAAIAGAAIGALAGYAICGREACFGPAGSLPLMGWYIVAIVALSALFYDLNAEKRGF